MAKSKDTIKVSLQSCRAAIDKNSFNEKDNTIEVVFATETPVRKYNFWEDRTYNEVLEISEQAVDLSRLKSGAAVLNTHDSYRLDSVIGVVEDAWVANREARAKIRLSDEEADATIVNKIRKGIIRSLSAGYNVSEYKVSEPDADVPTFTATRWQPMEISFVPVPADYNSSVRKRSTENEKYNIAKIVNPTIMEDNQNEPAVKDGERKATPTPAASAPATPAIDENQVRFAAVQEERQRVSDITATCITAGLPNEFAQSLISDGKTINEARAAVIEEVAKRSNPAPTGQGASVTGEDEAVKIRSAIIDGIMSRSVPGSVDLKGNEKATAYRNMRLLDIAKDRLRAKGESFSMLSEQEIVKRAWATTDYADLLTSTLDRTLRRFYEGSVDDWKFIARQENAVDFREKTGIKVDGAVTFEEIPEGGEYRESPILQSEKATIKLKKYGRRYSISDIAIINDDLGVFSRLPRIMAIGAQQFQSEQVWDNIISNNNAPDGKAMFIAAHNNLATSGAVISETTLSTARTAMRRQTSPAGHKLGIRPKYLLVPPELETTAEKIVSSVLASATTDVNVFANKLQVVVSDALTDKKAWYLVADPATTIADGIIYAYLNGQPGLRTESRVNWNTDALEVKGSMAFATTVWGYEGWYKNPGA